METGVLTSKYRDKGLSQEYSLHDTEIRVERGVLKSRLRDKGGDRSTHIKIQRLRWGHKYSH